MAATSPLSNDLLKVLSDEPERVVQDWMQQLSDNGSVHSTQVDVAELKRQMTSFLRLLNTATSEDPDGNIRTASWAPLLDFLEELSRSRAVHGFTASETATFVFALKRPLFQSVGRRSRIDPEAKAELVWRISTLIDQLGMRTFDAYLAEREQVIRRQQEELLELSTPVIKVWDGVLALPMIGTLDSSRTQIVMETLLQRIVETGAELAIIDITGVPTVDTLVAQHLIKT